MKRLFTAIMVVCLMLGGAIKASAANGDIEQMLSQLSENKDVSTVYISQAMLRSIAGGKIGNMPVGKYAYSIDNVQVYTYPSEQTSKEAMKIVKKYISETPNIETLVKVKDIDSETAMYAIPKKKGGSEYSQVILFTFSKAESSLVIINGNLSQYNIGDLAGKNIKNL